MRRAFSFLWKATISLALLYAALRFVDFTAFRERIARLDPGWISAGLLTLLVQIGIASVRWQLIATRCGAPPTLKQAFSYTLIGTFFNQALPSTVGGDASRIWLLARAAKNWKGATYSVLIDRVIGLIWLAAIVLVCLPWSLRLITNPVGRITLVVIGSVTVLGPLGLYIVTRLGRSFFARWRITRHFTELAGTLLKVLVTPRLSITTGSLSIAVHLLTVLFIWLAASAIHAPLMLSQALLLIPPVILIAAVPISIGGWGVREGAMVAAFAYAGLAQNDAFAVSVLFGAGMFVIGLAGGFVWILSGERGLKVPDNQPTSG